MTAYHYSSESTPWRPISFAPAYQVSKSGAVLDLTTDTPRLLKPTLRTGHPCVRIDGQYRRVADLVMAVFGPMPPTAAHIVGHRNGDKTDTRISNLEWRLRARPSN